MYKYLILIIFFYACDDPTSSEIPPIYGDGDSVYSYTLSLASPNSGDYIDYATITWNQYHNYSEDFISYTIRDENETIIELEDVLLESYDIAINWYNSKEYLPIREIRENNSEGNVIIIEGY